VGARAALDKRVSKTRSELKFSASCKIYGERVNILP